MPKRHTGTEGVAVHLRRMYVDCRYGQLHVHSAFASNGGFDELTTLVCLHDRPGTGRVFRGLLQRLGADRSVYAPDLPGCGESDPAPARAGMAADAVAIGDFLDQLRLREVDLLGYRSGAAVAAELAAARPAQVRRIVLVGAPARLAQVTQPVLADLPDAGANPFDTAPDDVASRLRAFLD